MPRAIFILAWDTLEGAVIERKIPPDIEISINDIQTIDVAHQFNQDSEWIIVEDSSFKAVSVFNQDVQKSLVLVLNASELPGNFTKFLVELAGFVLPRSERPDVLQRLDSAFSMIQAEIPVQDLVLMNLANRIEALEGEKLDLKERVEAVLYLASEETVKILLHLVVQGYARIDDIADTCGIAENRVHSVLATLQQDGHVIVERGVVRLVQGFDQVVASRKTKQRKEK